jgi:hypothetical protein
MAGLTIGPDDPNHQALENSVTEYLKSVGYFVDSAPYHDKMYDEIVRALQNIYTPTALYLRSRADRIAVRSNPPSVFEWEVKTHASAARHDCTLEAYPICVHILKHRFLGVRCLYVYWDPIRNYNVGWWIHQMPPIKVIMIPPRWRDEQIEWFESLFTEILPDIDIVPLKKLTKGSNDPFLIIDEKSIRELPHWKGLISND